MIVTVPAAMPVICGCTPGDTEPAPTNTVGVTVAFELSVTVRVMYTPCGGAAVESAMGNAANCPGATVRLAGTTIDAGCGANTVTLALAAPKPGVVAEMVAVPAATPVTGTFTLTEPAAKTTVEGTLATAAFVELTVAVRPAVAGADRVRVRF